MRVKTQNLAWFALAAICLLLFLFSPFHEFKLWSQVTYLRGSVPNLGNLSSEAHLLRYLLVYPIFVLSDQTGLNADYLFRLLCFVMLFLTIRHCTKMADYYLQKNELYFIICFALLFLLLSAFMNGRIIFAFLGFSYLLLSVQNWEKKQLSNLGLCLRIFPVLFLCSVSSGTFLSCLLGLILWSVVFVNRPKKSLYLYGFMLLVVLSPVVNLYVFKNINFYGGGFSGFVNMLNHGAGKIFHLVDFASLTLIILIIAHLSVIGIALLYYEKKYRLHLLFTASCMVAGLFGYSTLSLAIIPVSILMTCYSAQLVSRKTQIR